jgi:hypothetical protein
MLEKRAVPVSVSMLERVGFALNAAPAPVLDYVGALGLQAVLLALRLNLFELLRRESLPVAEIARQVGAQERGISLLLGALATLGYTQQRGDRFVLTGMAEKWTPRLAEGARFYEELAFTGWNDVEARLRGEPTREASTLAASAATGGGMFSNARLAADEVARRVAIPRHATRLLDVGGGHGLYAAAFCQRYKRLSATVFDKQPALELLRNLTGDDIGGDALAARVLAQDGDFWSDDLGTGYDVALVFNLLNAFEPARRVELLRRVAQAIARSGIVVVLDSMRDAGLRGAARAVVELTTLRLFDPNQHETYGSDELISWIQAAGLHFVRSAAMRSVPWVRFAIARRSS